MSTTPTPHELFEIAVYIGGAIGTISFIAIASDEWLKAGSRVRRWHR